MQQIEQLVREAIGLDVASLGRRLVERIVRERMRAAGVRRFEDYLRLIQLSAHHWNELVESVVVSETWFFRDPEAFSVCVDLVQREGLVTQPRRKTRILSVPCASGEEPFSIAMALLDYGVPASRVEIEAIDISGRALERARQGVFGLNSFRGRDLEFRRRHFHHIPAGFALNANVRGQVRFYSGNLLGDEFATRQPEYDFIFCRNLLIYFDRATQQQVFERLRRLLATDGILFVGPAELPLAMQHGFVGIHPPKAFACRPASEQVSPTIPAARKPGTLPTRSPVQNPARGPVISATNGVTAPDLDLARRLADSGRMDEAAAICDAFLRERGASATAYYLLGLIHDAAGHPRAADFYRRAVYLEPGHHEALAQLSLLLQKNGNTAQARALKRRAERARRQSPEIL